MMDLPGRGALATAMIAVLMALSLSPLTVASAASYQVVDTWSVSIGEPIWNQVDTWDTTVAIVEWRQVDEWDTTVTIVAMSYHQIDSWTVAVASVSEGWEQIDQWNISVTVSESSYYWVDEWNATASIAIGNVVDAWNITIISKAHTGVDYWHVTILSARYNLADLWRGTISSIYTGTGLERVPPIVAQVFGVGGGLMILIGFAGSAWLWRSRKYSVVVVLAFAAFMIILGVALLRTFVGF